MANKVFLFVTLALLASLVAAEVAGMHWIACQLQLDASLQQCPDCSPHCSPAHSRPAPVLLLCFDCCHAETQPSRKLMRMGNMYAQQETAAAIERAVMSGADPATTQAATWVGAATARAATGRNRWGWGRGGWWDRR